MQYQKRALALMEMIIFLTCFSLIIPCLKPVKLLVALVTQDEQALLDGPPP